jgi:hypothetical protein
MLVQVNTDNHIENKTSLQDWVRGEVQESLGRFEPQLTRAEIYLSDLNSHKNAQVDKQCTIEVRIAGLDPIAVTKEAGTVEAALDAALEVLTVTLDSRIERLHEKKGRTPMGGEP